MKANSTVRTSRMFQQCFEWSSNDLNNDLIQFKAISCAALLSDSQRTYFKRIASLTYSNYHSHNFFRALDIFLRAVRNEQELSFGGVRISFTSSNLTELLLQFFLDLKNGLNSQHLADCVNGHFGCGNTVGGCFPNYWHYQRNLNTSSCSMLMKVSPFSLKEVLKKRKNKCSLNKLSNVYVACERNNTYTLFFGLFVLNVIP